jgi:hypothetical protein
MKIPKFAVCLILACLLGVSVSDLIYHALFIVSQVFQIVLCVDALYQRNTGMSTGTQPSMAVHILCYSNSFSAVNN